MTETTPTPVSQDRINRAAWEACDTFRGVVDKNYLLVMLFLKYISDMRKYCVSALSRQLDLLL